jgi:N-methylhydantoinase B
VTDPVKLEVFKHLFQSVAEEMGETLRRTSHSPNIKERRDYSCAVFDRLGRTVAQAEHMPVHLGSMPESAASAIAAFELGPGDAVMLNDPFRGGTHLPDVTVVEPVFASDSSEPVFYVANRAHHADIGGMSPGSLPLATEIYQEGLIIPPLLVKKGGNLVEGVLDLILANVRTPKERRSDLISQMAANAVGVRRLSQYLAGYGTAQVMAYASGLQDYAERYTRRAIEMIPDGVYCYEDYLDDDGLGATDLALRACVSVQGDQVVVDFSDSALSCTGNLNAVRAITKGAVFYVFRAVSGHDVPSNDGGFRPIEVVTKPGTIVDARRPAAVGAGNVETSQRIVDVVLGALAQALPEAIPAASQGTMNNLTLGGFRLDGQPFAYYETIGGGAGAGYGYDGVSAVHTHMTNSLNTPIEALERELPLRVVAYKVRTGSGGAGRYRGGDGVVRSYLALGRIRATLISERRRHPPYGLEGGEAGRAGKAWIFRSGSGEKAELPGKWTGVLEVGDVLEIETPGGGGWGSSAL